MNSRKSLLSIALLVSALISICARDTSAQTFTVVHDFGGNGDGDGPGSPLLFDANGNIYGATSLGPPSIVCPDFGCGTVFQLVPNGDGTWNENVLYYFETGSDSDPNGPLISDGQGVLYGAAAFGGGRGAGTVFKLMRSSDGSWHESSVHNFSGGSDGGRPLGLLFDEGQIYGSTYTGGLYGSGVVFDLRAVSTLNWYELVTHAFGRNNDGIPNGWLTVDTNHDIYGASTAGGSHGYGTVFKLTPNHVTSGWKYTRLYDFTGGPDGAAPNGFLIFDASGNLYGTAYNGGTVNGVCGSSGCGLIFELTPSLGGNWSERVLYSFSGSPDGQNPNGGVTLDAAGNLYGATASGGAYSSGILFKLTQSNGGEWTETWVHDFDFIDGMSPIGGLVLDGVGNLYGVTAEGGTNVGQIDVGGVAFEITP